jgi:hypothetical protein
MIVSRNRNGVFRYWLYGNQAGSARLPRMSDILARALPWRAVTTWIAIVAAIGFFAIGLRALLAPAGAASAFGLPLADGDGLAYVRAFGARNIGLSIVALTLIVLDVRRGLAAVFLAGALIAALDFSIVAAQLGPERALKHLGYVAGLAGFGLWLQFRR